MKHFFLLGLFVIVLGGSVIGQINMADSTVQVIGYWDLHEKESYSITEEKYKVQNSDTINRISTKYKVDVTIIDSTANSYSIEWRYYDYETSLDNTILQRIAKLGESMQVVIRTDEYGTFKEVANYKEIVTHVNDLAEQLRNEFAKEPQIDKIVEQIRSVFSSKEIVEAMAVKEIKQFYSFHGGIYELGEEYTAQMKITNATGGDPFDAEVTVMLDEIDGEQDDYVMRSWINVDSKQLTDATYEYMEKLASAKAGDFPTRESFPELNHETRMASLIHGPSGWVIYSIETKEVSSEGIVNVEERVIDLL
jgi:uncharacterized protein YbaA (DUF1428 family)